MMQKKCTVFLFFIIILMNCCKGMETKNDLRKRKQISYIEAMMKGKIFCFPGYIEFYDFFDDKVSYKKPCMKLKKFSYEIQEGLGYLKLSDEQLLTFKKKLIGVVPVTGDVDLQERDISILFELQIQRAHVYFTPMTKPFRDAIMHSSADLISKFVAFWDEDLDNALLAGKNIDAIQLILGAFPLMSFKYIMLMVKEIRNLIDVD